MYLQATKKALRALGLNPAVLGPPSDTIAPLGDWIVNVVPVGRREAYLFMNTRTLLSFPILIGNIRPEVKDMSSFLSHGLKLMAEWLALPAEFDKVIIDCANEIALCVNEDKSISAFLQAIAADYDFRIERLSGCTSNQLNAVISAVNSTPRAKIGYRTSREATLVLLHARAA